MRTNNLVKISLRIFVVCTMCVTLTVGCNNPSRDKPKESSETKSQTPTAPTKTEPDTGSPLNKTENSVDSRNAPSRTKPVGHAVALAGLGLKQQNDASLLFINDPADNPNIPIQLIGAGNEEISFKRGVHTWLNQPEGNPISFGKTRPTIVLADSNPYTIVGAVVIRPGDAIIHAAPNDVTANRMPDLSQDLRPNWKGLCAATSAADVLYYAGRRDPRLLDGRVIGPAPNADTDADLLIAGPGIDRDQQNPDNLTQTNNDSLAFLMNNKEGDGSSAVDIAQGMRSWIQAHSTRNWRVDIDFLDTPDGNNSIESQKKHLKEWAGAIADGGGSVVLLWPGAQSANSNAVDQNGSEHDSDPQFPPLIRFNKPLAQTSDGERPTTKNPMTPPPKQTSRGSQTQAQNIATEKVISELESKLKDANGALRNSKYDRALDLSKEIIERVLPHRFTDHRAEQLLAEATRIAKAASAKTHEGDQPNESRPTRFAN